jgi:hypothetical protein
VSRDYVETPVNRCDGCNAIREEATDKIDWKYWQITWSIVAKTKRLVVAK